MRLLPAVTAALLCCGLLAGCGSSDDDAAAERDALAPTSGGRLPDVRLDALGGPDGAEALELADLRGPTVVNLWASWCGPCEDELPRYEEFAQEHDGEVDVVGIDTRESSLEAAEQLLESTGVTYPNYADVDDALQAVALPKLVLVDSSGEIALEQYVEIDTVAQLEDLVREHLGVDL